MIDREHEARDDLLTILGWLAGSGIALQVVSVFWFFSFGRK